MLCHVLAVEGRLGCVFHGELRNGQKEFVGRILEHWNWATEEQKGTEMVEVRQIRDDGDDEHKRRVGWTMTPDFVESTRSVI
jgi:hypothetical protein